MKIIEREKLQTIFNRVASQYELLSKKQKLIFQRDNAIDCPLDYARYILDELICIKGEYII